MEGPGGGGEQEKSYSRPFMSQGSQGDVYKIPYAMQGFLWKIKLETYENSFILHCSLQPLLKDRIGRLECLLESLALACVVIRNGSR